MSSVLNIAYLGLPVAIHYRKMESSMEYPKQGKLPYVIVESVDMNGTDIFPALRELDHGPISVEYELAELCMKAEGGQNHE